MRKLSKIWAQQRFLPSQTEMCQIRRWPRDNRMSPTERTSDVRCVVCGGNHPVNCIGCTVYEDLQKKTYSALHLKQYTPPKQIKLTLSTQPRVTCSNNHTEFLRSHKYRARATYKPISSAKQRYTGIKKYDEKSFWTCGNYTKTHNRAY
jgi:hypothetical protein